MGADNGMRRITGNFLCKGKTSGLSSECRDLGGSVVVCLVDVGYKFEKEASLFKFKNIYISFLSKNCVKGKR